MAEPNVLSPSQDKPVTYRISVRRFPILLPLSLLAVVTLVSATAAVLHLPVGDDLRRVWQVTVVFLAVFYFGYIRRTVLTVSEAGLTLRQSFASWTVTWPDVAATWTSSNLDVTHKGGVAAGLHLKLRTGKTVFIPDLFDIHRRELAKLVIERSTPSSVSERLEQARN